MLSFHRIREGEEEIYNNTKNTGNSSVIRTVPGVLFLREKSVFEVEGDLQVFNLLVADVNDVTQVTGVEDGVRGGLHDFQAVKRVEKVGTRDDHAVIFHDGCRTCKYPHTEAS